MERNGKRQAVSSLCSSLRNWWTRFRNRNPDNAITRNSDQICKLGKMLKQGESEVDTQLLSELSRIRFMVLCLKCGNKRCPHAASKLNECTNSNEPGQPGSNY